MDPTRPDNPVDPVARMIPRGWSPAGWLDRLRYMAKFCTNERRRTELKLQVEHVESYVRRLEAQLAPGFDRPNDPEVQP